MNFFQDKMIPINHMNFVLIHNIHVQLPIGRKKKFQDILSNDEILLVSLN